MCFPEVERGAVGGALEKEDGACVEGGLFAVSAGLRFCGRVGGGRAAGMVMGEEDGVGVEVESCEQCFWYAEGGRVGIVVDLGRVGGGEDVDFEGEGGEGVEEGEEVGVGCGG